MSDHQEAAMTTTVEDKSFGLYDRGLEAGSSIEAFHEVLDRSQRIEDRTAEQTRELKLKVCRDAWTAADDLDALAQAVAAARSSIPEYWLRERPQPDRGVTLEYLESRLDKLMDRAVSVGGAAKLKSAFGIDISSEEAEMLSLAHNLIAVEAEIEKRGGRSVDR